MMRSILTCRSRLVGAAASVLLAAALAGDVALARDTVQPGQSAPDFATVDSHGKPVTLASFKGKIVILEWNNPGCPYVRKHYGAGNMQSLQKEATSRGVVWLTINSGPPGAQGHVNGIEAEQYVADRKASPTAYLLDPDGKVGRAFGATVTPHMFVIDSNGKIAYMGGIDDKPTANQDDIKSARNYVREAFTAVLTGQSVKTTSARPYGCQIKYTESRS